MTVKSVVVQLKSGGLVTFTPRGWSCQFPLTDKDREEISEATDTVKELWPSQ